jgi:hypothetical protein
MTEISFDSQSFGVVGDHECADVRGPGSANAFPPMMRRKFIGQPTGKVVCLAHIYRMPTPIAGRLAEKVDASNRVEHRTDRMVLEFIPRAAGPSPNDDGAR